MTLKELIERLQEQADHEGEDTQVRAVVQPNYPMLASVTAVQSFIWEDDGETYVGLRISENEDYGAPRDQEWELW